MSTRFKRFSEYAVKRSVYFWTSFASEWNLHIKNRKNNYYRQMKKLLKYKSKLIDLGNELNPDFVQYSMHRERWVNTKKCLLNPSKLFVLLYLHSRIRCLNQLNKKWINLPQLFTRMANTNRREHPNSINFDIFAMILLQWTTFPLKR